MAISVPALMGFSLGKTIALSVCATLFLICSCDKHEPGEFPQVQREKTDPPRPITAAVQEETPAPSTSSTPAAKPTPVEFFPTKPR
jgi:hypothetical protein